jgi:hypothetical protein
MEIESHFPNVSYKRHLPPPPPYAMLQIKGQNLVATIQYFQWDYIELWQTTELQVYWREMTPEE